MNEPADTPTPRTAALLKSLHGRCDNFEIFCQDVEDAVSQMERELAAAIKERDEARERLEVTEAYTKSLDEWMNAAMKLLYPNVPKARVVQKPRFVWDAVQKNLNELAAANARELALREALERFNTAATAVYDDTEGQDNERLHVSADLLNALWSCAEQPLGASLALNSPPPPVVPRESMEKIKTLLTTPYGGENMTADLMAIVEEALTKQQPEDIRFTGHVVGGTTCPNNTPSKKEGLCNAEMHSAWFGDMVQAQSKYQPE